MPWQQMVADVGLELLPGTMIPAYREVLVTVPRQNGKTTLTLGFEVQRATGWGTPQNIAYTAQDGSAARKKLLKDQVPLLLARTSLVRPTIERVLRGAGETEIRFKNGSRIFPLNSTEDSGHGIILDLGVIDESWKDEDDRREQAMLPAMLTRPSAQLLNISTAGTDRSPFLKRKVDAGRAAVANGETEGIAYFEWSADEDADIDDPATWYSCMPALGFTITEATVRHMRSTMTEGEFRRAGLNLWTVSEERVIPVALWEAACTVDATPEGRLAIGVDADPDRASASIAIADGSGHIELVESRAGIGWVVERTVELSKKWDAPVAIDSYGPAAPLIPDMESEGIEIESYASKDMARACGIFYDAMADGKVGIRRNGVLDIAAAAARKRKVGDMWIWGRRDASDDVHPLIAATIAYDRAMSMSDGSEVWAMWA